LTKEDFIDEIDKIVSQGIDDIFIGCYNTLEGNDLTPMAEEMFLRLIKDSILDSLNKN